ncbi:lysylphosphatidylglycerol synthase transmembrane domain-containing protein [Capillimicrobium parvum]|uniref:Flippase-like domain-containing protein n=1 Tax=Capillimicrobium parvum TaxID=2884022 RepID=A0A9E7C210_9ACTN|nr:lysylphosphatidylglycerol synthase transmembrane domain-containing protein [Capillimicrobium parvum]UGS36988.1 hypothetical protein DSM104329_03400 [Capillimicrobium parvum]
MEPRPSAAVLTPLSPSRHWGAAHASRRRPPRALLLAAAGGAAVAAVLLLGGRPAQAFADALDRIFSAQPGWALAAVGFELVSITGYSLLLWHVAGRGSSRIDLRTSYQVTLAGAAATRLLPTGGMGGVALTLWTLQRAGHRGRAAVRTLLTFLVILYGVFFAAILTVGVLLITHTAPGHGPVAFEALGIFAGAAVIVSALTLGIRRLRSPAAAPAPAMPGAGRLARLRGHSGVMGEAVADALRLARRPDARLLGAPVWWGFDIAALWAAFHAFGAPPPFAVLVLAYFVGQLANTIPLPGSVSGGLVGVLVAFGTPVDMALAAVLAYRALAVWTPVAPGAVALAGLRRSVKRWTAEDAAGAAPAAAPVAETPPAEPVEPARPDRRPATSIARCACSGSSTATRRRSAASSGSSPTCARAWPPITASA